MAPKKHGSHEEKHHEQVNIDLSSASQEELERPPMAGKERAKLIAGNRHFENRDDLGKLLGFSEDMIDGLKSDCIELSNSPMAAHSPDQQVGERAAQRRTVFLAINNDRNPAGKDEGNHSDGQRIVIADDNTILREGLKALLSSEPQLSVVGEVGDGQEAIRAVEKFKPALVLIDPSMPSINGMDAIKEIKQLFPETKILVLTVHKTDEYLMASLQAGADGYVLKDCTFVELRVAIRNVLDGKTYISPGVTGRIIEGFLKNRIAVTPPTGLDLLTSREKGILKMIAEGYRNKEMADFLCLSVKTVEKHRANLMQKLDLHSVSALTAFAIDKGLITK